VVTRAAGTTGRRPSRAAGTGPATHLPRTRVWEQLVSNPPGVDDFFGVKLISRALLDPNPDQPRKASLRGVEELAESIREHGLLQPIVVASPQGGRYVIQAGHRRKAAYDWLAEHDGEPSRWVQIPALVKDVPTADRLVVALVENLSREELTDAEIITALGLLRDLHRWSQAEIARRLGVSRAWIMQYFRVAGDPTVSEHVQTEQLSVATAYDVVLARSDEAKAAALGAALQGAPRRVVRQVAKQLPSSDADGWPAGATYSGYTPASAPPAPEARYGDAPRASESVSVSAPAPQKNANDRSPALVASAAPEAGVHDLADLAAELGLTIDLRELDLMRLFRTAIESQTPHASLADLMRAARADLRRVEGLVRNTPRPAAGSRP
jgi:ParB/RepB/Spo0J family partition protein